MAAPGPPFVRLPTPVLPGVLLGKASLRPPPRTPVSTASAPPSQEHGCRAPLVLCSLSGPGWWAAAAPPASAGSQPHAQLASEPREPQPVDSTAAILRQAPTPSPGARAGLPACTEALARGLGVRRSPAHPQLLPAPPHRQLGAEGNPEQGRRHQSVRGCALPPRRRDKQAGAFSRPRCRQPPLLGAQWTEPALRPDHHPREPSLTSSPLRTLPISAPFTAELWKRGVRGGARVCLATRPSGSVFLLPDWWAWTGDLTSVLL